MNRSTNEERLRALARTYVASLGAGDFESIPYAEKVELRAPLCPGGSSVPLVGREALRTVWWAPLPELVAGTDFLDSYVNEDFTSVAVEFRCHIRSPACTLRIMDRFRVDDDGRIISQENFFDPRDVTHPGWSGA